jgi:hypothetical protein
MAQHMVSLRVSIYMPHLSLTFAILAKGRCFFGPSAKGLCSRQSEFVKCKNKLILRGATVGGLPLLKVLKNLTNMFFSISDRYWKLRL